MEEQLREINAKLDRVLAYIEKIESPEYKRRLMDEQFDMNLVANMVGERFGEIFPWRNNNG